MGTYLSTNNCCHRSNDDEDCSLNKRKKHKHVD
jgi:hypothetical protein